MYWLGQDFPLGWWVDKLEIHEDREGRQRACGVSVVPETIGVLPSKGENVVSAATLGSFAVEPEEVYSVGLRGLAAEPSLELSYPSGMEQNAYITTWCLGGEWLVAGLGVTYKEVLL